ncbi:hypothetical protein AB0E77_27890 [Streptomyces sp. NPDC032940]|uniref:hypothetical protein n=1 Tax=Streptomyces sp. NPDC032940 TaxID=3155366 RepID=UPI00340F09AC
MESQFSFVKDCLVGRRAGVLARVSANEGGARTRTRERMTVRLDDALPLATVPVSG